METTRFDYLTEEEYLNELDKDYKLDLLLEKMDQLLDQQAIDTFEYESLSGQLPGLWARPFPVVPRPHPRPIFLAQQAGYGYAPELFKFLKPKPGQLSKPRRLPSNRDSLLNLLNPGSIRA